MSKDEIKTILRRHFDNRSLSYNPLDELDAAARTIAALPVDKVQAMAALTSQPYPNKNYYSVPGGNGRLYTVRVIENGQHYRCWAKGDYQPTHCDTEQDAPCEHVQAVKLYTAQQATEGEKE